MLPIESAIAATSRRHAERYTLLLPPWGRAIEWEGGGRQRYDVRCRYAARGADVTPSDADDVYAIRHRHHCRSGRAEAAAMTCR